MERQEEWKKKIAIYYPELTVPAGFSKEDGRYFRNFIKIIDKVTFLRLTRDGRPLIIVFGNVANTYSVFLIQNMFPVTEEYIESQYIKNKVGIKLYL